MKSKFIAAAITAILYTTTSAKADGISDTALTLLEQKLPKTLESLYQNYQLKGDFLLAVVDKTGLRYSYTLNEKGSTPESNGLSIKTPFLIASHTKAFTGTLAQVLDSDGRFELDAPIHKYLAEEINNPKINTQAITVTQLLNHTAGFTSIMHTFKTAFLGYDTEVELVDALNTDTMIAPAGVFRYSNTGPILAAHAMKKATGKSWKTLIKEKVFAPLQMQDTGSMLSDYLADTILPSIEVDKNGEILRTGLFKTDETLHAAGGNISTLADMAKWLTFNLTQGKELSTSADFFEILHKPTTSQDKRYFTYERTGYSLAWDIADYHGDTILTRFGGYAGVSFHASFMPEEGVAVVAFFNDQRGYVLPHLAANFAYNLVTSPELAQSRYANEVKRFEKSFAREQANALDRNNRIAFTTEWKDRLGAYVNTDGWPEIVVYQNGNDVWLRSGGLSGPVYAVEGETGSFVVNLGPIRRPIKFSTTPVGDVTMLNGSLEYSMRN
ncbi:serine hydrolase domain-containing protein [Kangiella sp.]|uniref:serine hydrolase domain-containing protein n=1 Tax=Kangiella sp. TaxID=1920245 RepID=UPI003A933EC2